ncbi:Tetratricopeptide repeat protein 37 [Holothuria leucospilota]|uniref:Tetratricopeptide repeat protein 37 n=1 Tax=Holothuria leucospilota TaxID=206669 RepID=A0A9Q1BMN1_HOLLE|nr:Tetratricopeptide repeat protein 37 [Holothuria leucospilota]
MASGKTSLSKEAKAALKSAKEAIKNKEYKEAIKFCKIVLKEDKSHYNGLVFVGVAATELGQPDQGIAAYKKAIDADPNQELAWQGLCSLYEKSENPEHKAVLAETYPQLMKIYDGKDDTKWMKIVQKLIQCLTEQGQTDQALTELIKMIATSKCVDNRTQLELRMQLVDVSSSKKSLRDCFEEQVESAFSFILKSEAGRTEEKQKYHKEYIDFILKRGYSIVERECAKMHEIHPSDPYPIAVLVEFNLQQDLDALTDSVFISLENLRALDPSHPLIDVAEGQTKLSRRNYPDAKNALLKGVQRASSNPYTWLYLSYCHRMLHEHKEVESTVQQGLRALKDYSFPGVDKDHVEEQFLLQQSSSLIDTGLSSNAAKALEITEKLMKRSKTSYNVKITHLKALLCTRNIDEAKQLFAELSDDNLPDNFLPDLKILEGQLAFCENHLEEALESFHAALVASPNSALTLYWLGRVYWQMGGTARTDRTKCLESLLKAAKLDPYYSDTFVYLGYFYQMVAEDLKQARRCFHQAFHLNPDSEEAGSMLGDVLIALGEKELALQMYNNITSKAPAGTAKWAWFRLGLYHFKFGDPTEAIKSFQCALRADPKDKQCWECLGDAFIKRGSYSAAERVFTRALELGGPTTYCQYQIASIKQMLGLYAEAVTEYQKVLTETQNYVPALKGQGETYIRLAQVSLQQFFNGRAVDYVEKAIGILGRASVLRPDLCCVWSLLGSASSLIFRLDEDLVRVSVPSFLLPSSKINEEKESRVLKKSELLALGARCYTRALQLQPENGNLWCDLGVNYFHQSQCSKENEGIYSAKAFQCVQKALSVDGSNHKYWTSLGTICSSLCLKRPSIAQHCFIKSIQLEPSNVVAWTNLGVLYLCNNDVKKAHKAFRVAQSLEPSYVQCWVGQAMIAERIGSEEAMDLFRHTLELTTHVEGSIGYAHWVCQTILDPQLDQKSQLYLYNILQMDAVSQAAVAMARYNDRNRHNPCALMLYGLLLERQKLHKSAMEAFKRSAELLEEAGNQSSLTLARLNYARSLSSCGYPAEAAKQYEAIGGLTDSSSILGYALSLYKEGNFQKCFQAYEQALEVSEDQESEAHILAALGMVAYKSGDVNKAKTMLFKSSQKSPPSEQGLRALCAVGLQSHDAMLSQAVITELEKIDMNMRNVSDLAVLKSALLIMQNEWKAAVRNIASLIHRHPWRKDLWQTAANFIVQYLPSEAEKASLMMQKVYVLQDAATGSSIQLQAVCDLAAGNCLRTSSKATNCISSAQRAIFMFPDNISNWSLLAGGLISKDLITGTLGSPKDNRNVIDRCVTFVSQQVKLIQNPSMEHWTVLMNLWMTLHQSQYEKCINHAKQYAEWCDYPEPVIREINLIRHLAESLKLNRRSWELENLTSIKEHIMENLPSSFGLQVLASLYRGGGFCRASRLCLKYALIGEPSCEAFMNLRLCKLAIDVVKHTEKQGEWLPLAQEALQDAKRIKLSNPTCLNLLQGLLRMAQGNER